MIQYEAKDYEHLIGLEGFSSQLLKNHFALYEAYVKNCNQLIEKLAGEKDREKTEKLPEDSELRRRFAWEFNGMRLHEYYFDGMKKGNSYYPKHSGLVNKIAEDFGSNERWEKDFKATGAMRGVGWAALYFEPTGNHLFNVWINEHDAGHLAGSTLLLVLDVFEHAFMLDYGVKREEYIEAFFNAVDWEEVCRRFTEVHLKKG